MGRWSWIDGIGDMIVGDSGGEMKMGREWWGDGSGEVMKGMR